VEFTYETRFDQPVERVYPYVADPTLWGEYVAAVVERTSMPDTTDGAVPRWQAVDRLGPMRVSFTDVLVERDEGHRVVWRHSAPWNATTEYRLEPDGSGARLSMRFTGSPSGPLWFMGLIPGGIAARMMARDFARLRQVLGSGSPADR